MQISNNSAIAALTANMSAMKPKTSSEAAELSVKPVLQAQKPQLTTSAPVEPVKTDAPQMMTMDGLMQEWGATDSVYDLDGNGTVGVEDLLALLAQGGELPMPAPEMTTDDIMAAWGETDSIYDLDGNGTVGVEDMLALLDQQEATAATADATDEPVTADGFEGAWGDIGGAFDVNGDGTVNVNDLLDFLAGVDQVDAATPQTHVDAHPGTVDPAAAQIAATDTPQTHVDAHDVGTPAAAAQISSGAGAAGAASISATVNPADGATWTPSKRVQQLAMDIMQKLQDGGYEKAPPADLLSKVQQATGDRFDTQWVMEQIMASYQVSAPELFTTI